MKYLSIIILLSLVAFISCKDATTDPENKESLLKISGKIQNPNNWDIPEDARAVLIWQHFYLTRTWNYVSHQGIFNKSDLTFEIEIKDFPKDSCMNFVELSIIGVAYIQLVAKEFPIGRWTGYENPPSYAIYGFVRNKVIIARSGSMEIVPDEYSWFKNFSSGLHLGEANESDNGFSLIETSSPLEMELVVDLEPGEEMYPDWY